MSTLNTVIFMLLNEIKLLTLKESYTRCSKIKCLNTQGICLVNALFPQYFIVDTYVV